MIKTYLDTDAVIGRHILQHTHEIGNENTDPEANARNDSHYAV